MEPAEFVDAEESSCTFPESLPADAIYTSIEALEERINSEATRRNLKPIKTVYACVKVPKTTKWKSLTYYCKSCSANMIFLREDGEIRLVSMEAQHTHSMEVPLAKRKKEKKPAVRERHPSQTTEMVIPIPPGPPQQQEASY